MRALAAVLTALSLTACMGGPAADGDRELTVFAAASLGEAFTAVAAAFEEAHPDVRVTLNLAGSQTLATQLLEGAPADVFAPADPPQLQRVVAAGRATGGEVFATNALAIAVEAGNPLAIRSLQDLARADAVLVLAADTVPAGAYARAVLARADVEVAPASLEPDVRAALGRVVLGEADAAVVYRSDLAATATSRVTGVAIAPEDNVTARYPVAALDDADAPELAAAFVAFLQAPPGRALLRAHGFGAP